METKCKWCENGMCMLSFDDNACNGTASERWECAYCSDYENPSDDD